MPTMGIDIGSLTAKAVILERERVVASYLRNVLPTAQESYAAVITEVLSRAGMTPKSLEGVCTTGYGRFACPLQSREISEILSHALGVFWLDKKVRTIIDIGGQDSKVIVIDDRGEVVEFAMNDKCAAGTGRALEILADMLGVGIEELGPLALKARHALTISDRCSIFMEYDVLQLLRKKHRKADIASAICDAVARRVAEMARQHPLCPPFCITGGVAKNPAVVAFLERMFEWKAVTLPFDPQFTGALGAAIAAGRADL